MNGHTIRLHPQTQKNPLLMSPQLTLGVRVKDIQKLTFPVSAVYDSR